MIVIKRALSTERQYAAPIRCGPGRSPSV